MTSDAKIPLAVAIGYVKELNSAKLMRFHLVVTYAHYSAKSIAELKKGGLDEVISDVNHRKAITNAAKRVMKVDLDKKICLSSEPARIADDETKTRGRR